LRARRRIALGLAAILLAAAPGARAASILSFETLALGGAQAAGLPAGVQYAGFTQTSLTEAGHVLIAGSVTGPGIGDSNDGVIWRGQGTGALSVAARNGTPPVTPVGTPGLNGANSLGEAAFRNNAQTVYRTTPGGAQQIAVAGGRPPGTATGVTYLQLGTATINDAGGVAFHARMEGTGVTSANDWALFAPNASGALALMVREGMQAPGLPAGVTFASLQTNSVRMGHDGSLIFTATLAGPGVTGSNAESIWVRPQPGVFPTMVLRQGSQVPGLPPGTNLGLSGVVAGGNGGGVVSVSLGIGSSALLHVDGSGNVDVLQRSGDPAPGFPAGVVLEGAQFVALNHLAEAAFRAEVNGPSITFANDEAIFAPDGAGGYRLVAREANQIPGLTGVSFLSFAFGSDNALVHSDAGDVAFAATLAGPAVNASSDRGLFYGDRDGSLLMVLREGDSFEVSPGVFKTLADFRVSTGDERTSINSSRELLFIASFTDGSSGVFRATFVPEPGTAVLVGAGVAALAIARRRSAGV
jgi:hypothetical protein